MEDFETDPRAERARSANIVFWVLLGWPIVILKRPLTHSLKA